MDGLARFLKNQPFGAVSSIILINQDTPKLIRKHILNNGFFIIVILLFLVNKALYGLGLRQVLVIAVCT